MYGLLIGELGLSLGEARSLTIYEMNRRIQGFRKKEDRDWHKIRVLASILISPHLKKGKKIKPEDLIPLPDEIRVTALSDEQKKADIERKLKAFRTGKREPLIKRK